MVHICTKVKMFRIVCGSMSAIVFLAALALSGSAETTNRPDESEARIASAMAHFQRFQSSHSIDDLKATSRGLFSAADPRTIKPADIIARRRSIVAGFAKVLHQIDLLTDPTFDPNDPKNAAETCVTPPREPSGRQLFSCADPKDIPDPATRAEYIAAINANSLKIQRGNKYLSARYLDDEVMQELQIVLRGFHSKTPPDGVALDNILRQARTHLVAVQEFFAS
jgi:hypothetical protein